VFVKGVANAKRLEMASPLLRITQGEPASIDFVQSMLNFVAKVRVVNTSTGQDGKDLEELQGVTIPVLISGPFEKPAYTVQWRGAVTDVLKRSLERKLKETADQKAGGRKLAPQLDEALKGILGK